METAWTTTGMSGHSHYVYINHHGNSFETRARGSVRTLDNPIRRGSGIPCLCSLQGTSLQVGERDSPPFSFCYVFISTL